MTEKKALVFGGTVEGRQVSDYFTENGVRHTVCVATEYGEEVLTMREGLEIRQGRMNTEEMCSLMQAGGFCAVVDATHPYAVEVSKNIRSACKTAGLPYLRYLRPRAVLPQDVQCEAAEKGNAPCAERRKGETEIMEQDDSGTTAAQYAKKPVFVNSAREAAQYLETQTGRIFLTTGSKELHVFTEQISDTTRLFARVLPSAQVIASCRLLGLEGKQICGMQGPFSAEMNEAMMRQVGASFLVTKDTGTSGGFPEKMEAAQRLGVCAVIIRRPEETGYDWAGLTERLRQVLERPDEETPSAPGIVPAAHEISQKEKQDAAASPRRITCVGIGMGTLDTLTHEAAAAIREADAVFGAKRMLESMQKIAGLISPAAAAVAEYSGAKIAEYLAGHPQYRRAAILMSGDVGFYSGARGMEAAFPNEDVRYVCGISSVVYFASKIPTAWQDAKLVSAHGKQVAVLNYVNRYPKLILLVSGREDVERICRELHEAELDDVRVTVGTNLSYPQERILRGVPSDFLACTTQGLHIIMIENPQASHVITPGLPDEAFVRGKVPMTKEEIRILSVAKLRLTEDAVVYDVGAGTGSVSAEIARLCTAGCVYAVERNHEGIELIRANSRKLRLSNVVAVEGLAPEALEGLPAPTHAFIGGSSGNMRRIIETLRSKNPHVRIVLNTIALESIAEVMNVLRELEIADADIVQVSAARSKTLGRYHMMNAQNPVYIVSFGGSAQKNEEEKTC